MKLNVGTWDQVILSRQKELDMIEEQRKLFEHVEPDFKHAFVTGDMPRLVIFDLNDLYKARKLMRKIFGKWQDKLSNKFYAVGRAVTTWKNPNSIYEIWLETEIEKDVTNGSCTWVPYTKTEYHYVCNQNS